VGREKKMTLFETYFVAGIVTAFTLFGITLAAVSRGDGAKNPNRR